MREKKFLLKFKSSIFLSISLFLLSCGGEGSYISPFATFAWENVTPESQGLSSAKVQAAMNLAMTDGRYTQAAMIIKNGKIVAENYKGIGTTEKTNVSAHQNTITEEFLDFRYGIRGADSLVTSWSIGKSITSIVFGIASSLSQFSGEFPNGLNTPAAEHLAEWAGEGDPRNAITIKNLLDMRSGLIPTCWVVDPNDPANSGFQDCDGTNILSGGNLIGPENQLTGCIARNLAISNTAYPWYQNQIFQSGSWLYQNCDTMVLGEIFYRATGQDIKSFADTYLFSKLGISSSSVDWWRDNSSGGQANGNYLSYCCVDMTARDFAKIALLLMNDGVWEGEQIIPLSYVQAIKNITTDSRITELGGTRSYGLKFWSAYGGTDCGLNNDQQCIPNNTVINAQGFDGQYLMMDFENKLIMIRFSLYHPIENGNTEKKLTVLDASSLTHIATVPQVLSNIFAANPLETEKNTLTVFFPFDEYWYALNNSN